MEIITSTYSSQTLRPLKWETVIGRHLDKMSNGSAATLGFSVHSSFSKLLPDYGSNAKKGCISSPVDTIFNFQTFPKLVTDCILRVHDGPLGQRAGCAHPQICDITELYIDRFPLKALKDIAMPNELLEC